MELPGNFFFFLKAVLISSLAECRVKIKKTQKTQTQKQTKKPPLSGLYTDLFL